MADDSFTKFEVDLQCLFDIRDSWLHADCRYETYQNFYNDFLAKWDKDNESNKANTRKQR